ncbi:glutamine synthetase III family protein [Catalinimonas niigatensis]|uniref:glutamine synthetase III family protein n=1 Tax=Catalinimonas niigatensis TaxID=1397264 RepID=UPI002666F04B|nr:glutamine synthetase III [Catalinimonas niigatensis]WPP48187.1 glutamine synthetase III [Catalinimonas niigatensis]
MQSTNFRFKALEKTLDRKPVPVKSPSDKISEYFGQNVFDKGTMRSVLSSDIFESLMMAIEKGAKIEPHVADAVASAMKSWAISRGVTHYTHWFQPLTGATAEKHDSFFEPDTQGRHMEKFKGSALVQQEPDASSFPSGGLRNTFEARGYTAWDPTSPAFIMENGNAKTLCIPTIFVSYTGEALDYKTPLLKAMAFVDQAATAICQEYFDENVSQVKASLGIEQEYFLIDRALYRVRPDLVLSGRTVFGHSPAKGQQLEDHYFGSIPTRVHNFMVDLEVEAHKLGIPIRTRHNEVAPRQFECAPMFEEINLAVDHNQLLMDLMEKIAEKHEMKVLLHEKPFAGINGSGKHNNWSLITSTGKNLLAPSAKSEENLQFLTFFVNTIKAVHEYNGLLRASIASAGNDHRLGANEAPPAIVSVFVGSQLTKVLEELESNANINTNKGGSVFMQLGINKIPPILLDNTDRNRTSPFAFTGNKFEFRAVGSSANSASPMTVLNTIVANQLISFKKEVDALIKGGDKKEVAIVNVLRRYTKESKAICFEGNGYSEEWKQEAEKRGLSNITNTPEALDMYLEEKSKKLFVDNNIYTEAELEARLEIMWEHYIMKVQIESRIMGDLALNHIIPATLRYQNELISALVDMKSLGLDHENTVGFQTVNEITRHLNIVKARVHEMIEARKLANKVEDNRERAIMYKNIKEKYFDEIRYHVDKLEFLVDDAVWPLAKYRELLF